jgi:hypothetical protein
MKSRQYFTQTQITQAIALVNLKWAQSSLVDFGQLTAESAAATTAYRTVVAVGLVSAWGLGTALSLSR